MRTSPAANRVRQTLVFALPLLFILIATITRSSAHTWGDDWAQYVNHARNLVEHRPYGDTGYLFNPARPEIGPPSYPPGTALVLAPTLAVTSVDIASLKLVGIACLGLGLAFAAALLTRLVPLGVAALTLCGTALHPEFWDTTQSIVSEPPFFLFTYAALFAASFRTRLTTPSSLWINAVLTGGLLALATTCRTIGLATVGAVVIHELASGRWRERWIWIVLACAAGGWLAAQLAFGSGDYSQELAQGSLARVASNVAGYWRGVDELFPLVSPLGLVTPFILLILSAAGLSRHVWAPAVEAGVASRGTVQFPLLGCFLLCQVGALVVLPFEPNVRYLVPLLPALLLYCVEGVGVLARAFHSRRSAIVAVAIAAVSVYYLSLWWRYSKIPAPSNALCPDCMALYRAVDENVSPTERVAFIKPRLLALMTRRSSWVWAQNVDANKMFESAATVGIRYLILVRPRHELAPLYPTFLSWDSWKTEPGLSLVYENPAFRLIRIEAK